MNPSEQIKLAKAMLSADQATLFNGMTEVVSDAVNEAAPGLELKATKTDQRHTILYGNMTIKNPKQRKQIDDAIKAAMAQFANPANLISAMQSKGVFLRTKIIK